MKRISIFLVLAISASMFLVSCGGGDTHEAAPEAAVEAQQEATEPVKEEITEEPKAEVTATADLANGEEIYKKSCFACHDAGVAGAAKLDDNARWTATAAKGLETVNKNALEGFTGENGMMPAKGGNASLTDEEITNSVAYMLSKAGVTAE